VEPERALAGVGCVSCGAEGMVQRCKGHGRRRGVVCIARCAAGVRKAEEEGWAQKNGLDGWVMKSARAHGKELRERSWQAGWTCSQHCRQETQHAWIGAFKCRLKETILLRAAHTGAGGQLSAAACCKEVLQRSCRGLAVLVCSRKNQTYDCDVMRFSLQQLRGLTTGGQA